MLLASHYNYWIVIALMMIGLYMVIAQGNLVKKIIGLNIFQTSVFIFYISVGKVDGGSAPILSEGVTLYSNPLPHVLILTAIVVGIATTSLALALIIRIKGAYGSIEERDIQAEEALQERSAQQAAAAQTSAGKEQ
ncbi:cation:proton antiporter subunit C [Microbulbifer sp. Q7]|uniref:cation:proton antiporter subunit C n=1 Tax=Microbulbifer sp. Q7 TaxID=1785091 RepID=UPI000A4BA929|nr:cation:proton antiporter subunit C [Microbulbifer sp. Q7]